MKATPTLFPLSPPAPMLTVEIRSIFKCLEGNSCSTPPPGHGFTLMNVKAFIIVVHLGQNG